MNEFSSGIEGSFLMSFFRKKYRKIQLIMEEKQSIVAAGAGASTKMVYPDGRIERIENVKDVGQYIDRIDEMIQRKKDFWEINGR